MQNLKIIPTQNKTISLNWYAYWMYENWVDQHIPLNSLKYLENMDYTENWSLMSRKDFAIGMGTFTEDTNKNYPITAIWTIWTDYVCVKWTWFYTVANSAIWTWHYEWWGIASPVPYTDIWLKQYELMNFYTIANWTLLTTTVNTFNERYIKVNATLTVWNYVWKYLHIWNEYKLITSNTINTIYIDWRFDETYAVSTSLTLHDKTNCVVYSRERIAWIIMYWTWTPYSFKTLSFSLWMCEVHNNRLYFCPQASSITSLIYFTDIWIADWRGKNSYIEVKWEVIRMKSFQDRLVIYTTLDIIYLYWDNEDNFTLEYQKTSKIINKWWSVANWNNIQIFYWKTWLEILDLVDWKNVNNSLWITQNIIDIVNANIETWHPFKWEFYDNKYFFVLWKKILVYDLDKTKIMQRHMFSVYDLTSIPNFFTVTTNSIVTAMKNIWWNLYIAINGWVFWFYQYFNNYYGTADVKMVIESNNINFKDSFRDKIYRRLRFDFASKTPTSWTNPTYTFNVYIAKDWWSYILHKTTTDLIFKVDFCIRAKNLQYKVLITPSTWALTITPLEMLQLDVTYEVLYKLQ